MGTASTHLDLDAGLRLLGYDTFRDGQRQAIETLLEQRRLLLVAPTGGGKSLTYQLPAALLPGTSFVVSPLIALMNDQVQALTARGVAATYLAGNLPNHDVTERMRAIRAGAFKIVYVSPERLSFPGFQSLFAAMAPPLIAIDEAHCISSWGHDFRPDYLRIGEVLSATKSACVLACTATATPVVRDEIILRLGLGADTPQIVRGFARPNLALACSEVQGDTERDAAVDAMLEQALGTPGGERGCVIVYAPTRASCEEEAARLKGRGWQVGAYHAGMNGETRRVCQDRFISRILEVVVATNAFGMGIDRPDVRAVIHLGPPGSLEAYYQEVGRAGRDGAPAHGLLLTQPGDLPRQRGLLEKSGAEAEVVEHKWNLFLELLRFAEGGACRHDAILRYFGDEAETLAGCGICDVCTRLSEGDADDAETTVFVQKALSGVARIHDRFGLGAAVQLLRGQEDQRLSRAGLTSLRTFGILRDESEAWVQALLRRCVTAGWVDFRGGDRPVAILTPAGIAVMKGERPARLLLPERRAKAARKSGRGKAAVAVLPSDPAAEAMFEALRAMRSRLAKERGVPPYVVASDRTLRDIAQLRPRNLDELRLAHGIGPAKAETFGQEILKTVAAFPAVGLGG